MPLALRNGSAANIGSVRAASLAVPIPAGTVSGDILVAFISTNSAANTCSTPAGWTQDPSSPVTASAGAFIACFYKIATGFDTTPTFNFNATRSACGWIGAYLGGNTGSPRDTSTVYNSGAVLLDTPLVPSIATKRAGEMVVFATSWSSGADTTTAWTSAGGFVEEIDQCTTVAGSSESAQLVNDAFFASPGPTGVMSPVADQTGAVAAIALALNAAEAPLFNIDRRMSRSTSW